MQKSEVFFIELSNNSTGAERIAATKTLLKTIEMERIFEEKDKVGIKLHVGEGRNDTHVSWELVREIVSRVKEVKAMPFLTETSTLYKGARSNAIDHLAHAFSHGFTYENVGAPFIMADGLTGNTEVEIQIPGILFKSVNIAREIVLAEGLIAVSHPTGHVETGLGACLKNLGMGLSSRIGKLRQHSSIKPYIDEKKCTFCKRCIRWCPVEAIVERNGKAFIIEEKCIGCGECLAVCSYDAVKYNWGVQSEELQKRIAEHALGAVIDKREKSLFLNFMLDMTKDCDCLGSRQKKIIPDVGILASRDPVAIDQATIDLTKEKFGRNLTEVAWPHLDPTIQLEHAVKIGLGSRDYNLIKVKKN